MQNRLMITAAALLGAAGCVKSYVPPEERVFPPGRYEYNATLPSPDEPDSARFVGTLVLDGVTPDSLVGSWDVPGYDRLLRANHWNVASYNVHARVGGGADTLTVVHSIQRGRTEGEPECRVSLTRPGYHADGTCTLRLQR